MPRKAAATATSAVTAMTGDKSLARYWAKRDFAVTAEPRGERSADTPTRSFVIQKHAASRLHYDFRLEINGVLVSWAVPKGPSYDPSVKRMAIHVEDHPLSYGSFEGTIPPKQYGAGTVIVWDNGTWVPIGDPCAGLAAGKLQLRMTGQKMFGLWELVKIAKPADRQEPWLLFKKRDEFARPATEYDVVAALPDSVIAKPLNQTPPVPAAATKLRTKRSAKASATSADRPAPMAGAARPRLAASTAALVRGAVKASLPDQMGPQLATLATAIPTEGTWVFEIKFDGYRIMTRIEGGHARMITRGAHDWSDKLPALVAEIESLGLQSAWLDGEIVVLDENGTPQFNALQKSFSKRAGGPDVTYFLFDLPYLEGHDLRAAALSDRRKLLRSLLEGRQTSRLRFSQDFTGDAASVLASACRMNLEGVIAKRTDARYASRRTDTWLKLKCTHRQEFIVCGYTDRSDGSPQIGSLLLGVHDVEGTLTSVGSVGTGWDAEEAQQLKARLATLETDTVAFTAGVVKPGRWSRRVAGSERWVSPTLVAEVEFAEWTPDGQIRHASYVGLRADKPPKTIVRETVKAPPDGASMRSVGATAVTVTHGERVIDATTGLTKLALVRYYESVAEFMLPHLKGRPCSLVRAPDGISGQQFFQKHGEKIGIPGITELDVALWPGHASLLEVGTAQALAGAAQMNVVEFHTWNSTVKNIDRPDRMVFDLDPGEGTSWAHIQEAALLVRGLLDEIGLRSWLKTSGGKGLHVFVPIAARLGHDTVKAFSQAVVQHLAKAVPTRFVARSGAANRVGKLFVDYLRNSHGATTAVAYSARARPGLGVSMPVAWDALNTLKSGAHWTIVDTREHLSFVKHDPWADYWTSKQTLSVPMKALGFKPPPAGPPRRAPSRR